ncbi:hypothetical protein [Shewanella baltica]|uniref:hypothetical protein n=1 Tax=Shewanella baltica TaxID=62322 RepID=UPI0032188907
MGKDASQQQSLALVLEESFKQIESEYKTGQSFVFSKGHLSNLFLPPPNEVMKLFGIANPILFGIEVAEQDLNLPLDIKSSSRHKLFTSGVGLPSVRKMHSWTQELFSHCFTADSIFTEQYIEPSLQVNSNAIGWYSLINNSEDMKQANISEYFHGFKPLLSFLTQRCKDDVECISRIKEQVDKRCIESMTLADKLRLQSHFWFEYSEVENKTWEMFSHFLLQHEQHPKKDKETELSVFRCFSTLKMDFYLAAIAHYEVGNILLETTNVDAALKSNGLLTKSILFYTQGDAKNCFDGLLHELKRLYSIKLGEVGWRQFAGFIEIEEDMTAVSGDSLQDKRYSRLKKWRKGEGAISNDKLKQFLVNLVGTKKEDLDFLVVLLSYAQIALALDKICTEITAPFVHLKDFKSDLNLMLKEVLNQYPEYYLRCMARELPKVNISEA